MRLEFCFQFLSGFGTEYACSLHMKAFTYDTDDSTTAGGKDIFNFFIESFYVCCVNV